MDNVDILEKVDGINSTAVHDSIEYVVLLKKTREKNYCTMYLTDCFETFWLERFDVPYFKEKVRQMNLNAENLEKYLELLVLAFNKSPVALEFRGQENQEAVIKVRVKMEGEVTINHTFELGLRIDVSTRPEEFRKINRTFCHHLIEAKNKQIKEIETRLEQDKQKGEEEKQEAKKVEAEKKNKSFMEEIFKDVKKPTRKGDLVNPNRKKRHVVGAKFEDGPVLETRL